MAVNKSVLAFKKLTDDLQKEIHDLAVDELNRQADLLIDAMKQVAPKGETGDLEVSIRKLPGDTDTIVRVVAGGRLTTEEGDYDYARAAEFGTTNMAARPFFFPTYRLMKKKMRSTMKRKITASIKKRSAE
jgi:HK97 gp10 family phage protein